MYEKVKEFYDEKSDQMSKIHEAIMAKDFSPVRTVYIDLTLIKDTRLGTLIAFAPSRKVLEYLIARLDHYNHDILRTMTTAYPEYPMGELEATMKRMDPMHSERIFNVSPDTKFSLNMFSFFGLLAQRNIRADFNEAIVVTINTYPLKETPFMRVWRNLLYTQTKGIRVEFITEDPLKLPASFWRQKDVLMLDDLVHLIDEKGPLYQSFYMERVFLGKSIYAPFQTTQNKVDEWVKAGADMSNYSNYPLLFSLTESVLALWCHLKYMDFGVPTPEGGE